MRALSHTASADEGPQRPPTGSANMRAERTRAEETPLARTENNLLGPESVCLWEDRGDAVGAGAESIAVRGEPPIEEAGT